MEQQEEESFNLKLAACSAKYGKNSIKIGHFNLPKLTVHLLQSWMPPGWTVEWGLQQPELAQGHYRDALAAKNRR